MMEALNISFDEEPLSAKSITSVDKSAIMQKILQEVEDLKKTNKDLTQENDKLKKDIERIASVVRLQSKASVRIQ